METTDYCSYELSKALKAAGFDEECREFYTPKGVLGSATDADDFNSLGAQYQGEWFSNTISAPTLAHAQKRLREGATLHVGAYPAVPTRKWHFYIDDLNQHVNPHDGELMTRWDEDMQEKADERLYDSYECALSAGIASALELIKKGE